MEWLIAQIFLLQHVPFALLIRYFNQSITAIVGMKNARQFSPFTLDVIEEN